MLPLLLAFDAPAPSAANSLERYITLFGVTAALLGAFLLLVVLLSFLRRRRMAAPPRPPRSGGAGVDAWSEAGRRAEPFGEAPRTRK